ncbi:MAG: TolC family protein [Treponema sp.]|nr:TolC family protein [Treponema sp.]
MRRIVIAVSLLFFLQLNTAQADNLTLDDAVKKALDYNLSLKKNEIDLAASGYSEKNIWMELFPAINANASAGYRNSLFSQTTRDSGFNYSIGLGISLGLNAGIPFTIKSIKLAHQGNILKAEDARNQLSIQITKMYYSLVAEKNNLALLNEVFNLAQRQYTRSETLFRNGLVGEMSLTQSRLALENARYNLNTAQVAHNNNINEFLASLGITGGDFVLSDEIRIIRIEADAEALIKEYLPRRPDLVRANQEIERLLNAQQQTTIQSRAPSLSLSIDWSSSSFNPFSDSFSASARLSIPVDPWIPGTPRNQTITRASDSVDKAKLDLEIAENSAKTQIRSLAALLHNSWDSVRIARLSLEAAGRNYQLTEQAFNSGAVEALTLQDSRNNMANARQRLLQTELSYFNMILDLSSALNIDWKYLLQTYGVASE